MKSKQISIGILILLLVGVTALLINNMSNPADKSVIETEEAIPAPNLTTVTVTDENGDDVTFDMSDWKVYSNQEFDFSFRYPRDMEINIPVMDVELSGFENTVFIVGITREDLENPDIFSREVGYGLQLDTKTRDSFKPFLDRMSTSPEDVLIGSISIESPAKTVDTWMPLDGFAKGSVFAYFQVNNMYVYFAKVGTKYSLAEYSAILSTLTFN